jgi:hypothetical protein
MWDVGSFVPLVDIGTIRGRLTRYSAGEKWVDFLETVLLYAFWFFSPLRIYMRKENLSLESLDEIEWREIIVKNVLDFDFQVERRESVSVICTKPLTVSPSLLYYL